MQKRIAIVSVTAVCIFLSGCQQQELSTTSASEKNQKAKGYVETLADTHKRAQENIGDAVDMQNQKNEEALSTLEGNIQQENNNSVNTSTSMSNIPEQINMDLAQTCKSATLKTNKGNITLKFYNDKSPVTVANFCTLAEKGFYDGVIFHRVIKDFMIQGGDPEGRGTGGPGYKFNDELPAAGEYKLGSLAMANSGPNTNGSQFFIVSGNNGVGLPPLYTLFGEVTEGMDVVMDIQETKTDAQDKPVEDIVIERVTVQM